MKNLIKKNENEFGNYLNTLGFDYFCTFSTPYEMTLKSARRAMERFFNRLNNMYDKCLLFWAAEPFALKEGYHLHVLIKRNSDEVTSLYKDKLAFNEIWQIVTKGSSIKAKNNRVHLRNYRASKKGSNYFCKRINQPNSDYDFLFNNNKQTVAA